MKIFSRILTLAVIAGMAFCYVGCGGSSSDPDPIEKVTLAKLSAKWTLASASLAGNDRTSEFDTKFALTLGGTFDSSKPTGPYSYKTEGDVMPNPSPWPYTPRTSTWSFSGTPTSATEGSITTAEGVPMKYTLSNSDANLKLVFTITGGGFAKPTARSKEVAGEWTFTFAK